MATKAPAKKTKKTTQAPAKKKIPVKPIKKTTQAPAKKTAAKTPTKTTATVPAKTASTTATLKNCLVSGGSGFLGSNLVNALLDKGCKVRVLDLAPPAFTHKNMEYIKADLRNQEEMEKACKGIDTVFHTAAIIDLRGGSAVTEEARKLSHSVNVEGGRTILKACAKQGVKRFVYTSSNNACFNGTPNPDMDSNTPNATRIYDLYTETKVIIEPEIRDFSGTDGVLTTVIRPAGIYGPGKNYMFNELISKMAAGMLVANLGSPNVIQDYSFIDNLVHAHILAAEHLVPGSPLCGKPYFITDNEPLNNFEFFRPIIEGLGYKFPSMWIPMWMVNPFLRIWQWLHFKFGLPRPVLTPKELDKVCVTHFSNIKVV